MSYASLRRAAAVGLIALVAMAAPVSAAHRYVDGGRVWLTVGVWGGWANFKADYEITKDRDAGMNWWRISDLAMTGLVERGKECPSFQCEAWLSAMSVKFLNSSGKEVAEIRVPAGYCNSYASPSYSRLFAHCYRGPRNITESATHIKLRWQISVRRPDGLWLSWISPPTVRPII